MTSRHALIVVVPENKGNQRFNLPIVLTDARDLEVSLKQSNYAVKSVGSGQPHDSSRGSILSAIRTSCEGVPLGGTLLLFFSGHGLHSNGRDYLVPWDADLSDTKLENYLVEVGEISRLVEMSPAANVVLFIDACREGIDLVQAKALGVASWGRSQRELVRGRRFSIVFSCEPGQYAGYVSGVSGFSLFSRAIAESISLAHPARTLKQVIGDAQKVLDELSRTNSKPRQTIRFSGESDPTAEIGSEIICDGTGKKVSRRETALSWEDAVQHSRLWEGMDTSAAGAEAVSAFKTAATTLAGEARDYTRRIRAGFGDDPWYSESYSVRVLRLVEELAEGIKLTLPEVALAVTAPFVRECAYAAAVEFHLIAKPLDLTVDLSSLSPLAEQRRLHIETTYRSIPNLIRRSQALRASATRWGRRGRSRRLAARNLALWAFYRHLARSGVQWQPAPAGSLPANAAQVAIPTTTGDDNYIREALSRRRLIKLAQYIRSDTDRLLRRDVQDPLENIVKIHESGDQIRERLIAALLCLAGWMAIDTTAVSDVVADHIGVGDPVDPHDLLRVTSAATWTTVGRMLQMTATCSHPAIDLCLREAVADANRALTSIQHLSSVEPSLREWAAALPGQLTPNGLSAELIDGRPAFSVPHQRFTLANDEIREILMGEELYGEPGLAIRELYQNALDACRYRLARTEFLSRRGGQRSEWKGQIKFTQGREGGRAYIECEDNGIGMGRNEIEACFSKAGKRFSDLPEYIEDQQLWRSANPKIEMTPNSRFGIGVLSYFMIADEIEVTTCRLDRDGNPLSRIEVSIPGSGSLFRIQTLPGDHDAGTRVRLYLRADWQGSCKRELESFLHLAEFKTEAREGTQSTVWQPSTPRDIANYQRTDSPDLWWKSTINPGQVVADGISTSFRYGFRSKIVLFPDRAQPPGMLLNLRGALRPRLTVDRKGILSFDEAAAQKIVAAQLPYLAAAPWLRLTWLWQLNGGLAKIVQAYLANVDAYVPLGYLVEIGATIGAPKPNDAMLKIAKSLGVSALAYPIRVIGINNDDDAIVSQLISSHDHDTALEQLRFLDRIVGYHIFRGSPDGRTALESWSDKRIEALKADAAFAQDPKVQRMALYTKLGFPTATWLQGMLPEVDVETVARRLEKPFDRTQQIGERIAKYALVVFRLLAMLVVGGLFAAWLLAK